MIRAREARKIAAWLDSGRRVRVSFYFQAVGGGSRLVRSVDVASDTVEVFFFYRPFRIEVPALNKIEYL